MRKLSHALVSVYLLAQLCLLALTGATPAASQERETERAALRSYTKNKAFDELTSAEHTKARQDARTRKLSTPLRVCADPGNMPLSSNQADGYQNKIAKIIAENAGRHSS